MVEGTSIDFPFYLSRILKKALLPHDNAKTQLVLRECYALAELAQTINEDGHGGIVLVVPTEAHRSLKSLQPFAYRFAPPDTTIRDAIRDQLRQQATHGEAFQQLVESELTNDRKTLIAGSLAQPHWRVTKEVRGIASLAGVDGAIVMTRDLQTLGFGATITVKKKKAPQVCKLQPEPKPQEMTLSPLEDLGGTRHQSAARFVAAYSDAVALVISQDRHLSIMHWHEASSSVAVITNSEWLG